MVDYEYCQSTLKAQFVKDFTQKNALSKLMTDSRWTDRSECFSYFWNMSNINNFLTNVQNNNEQQPDIYDTWNNETWRYDNGIVDLSIEDSITLAWIYTWAWHNAATETTSTTESNSDYFSEIWNFFHTARHRTKLIIILLLIFLILKKLLTVLFRRGYAFLNHNRMIYLKILVPRWDSKVDREQAKEVAKDMKEKIGRMTQVYTSLNKLWKLTFLDKIYYKLCLESCQV